MKTTVSGRRVLAFTLTLGLSCVSFAAALPDALTSGLVLWLDADKNTMEGTFQEKSGVIHWCDVRETFDTESFADHTFAYPCASATTTTTYANLKGGLVPPQKVTDAEGLPYVDFGLYGNFGGENKWMFIENGKGTLQNVTSRSLFCVVSFGKANNFGTVFGHIGGLTTSNYAKGYYYKNQPGGEGGPLARNTALMQLGETRLDGQRVDPERTTYSFAGRQVFSQVGPYQVSDGTAPIFNTLFNGCNQGTITQGGGRLSEVLVYDRVLSGDERAAVERYLSEKWLGAAFPEEKTSLQDLPTVEPVDKATYASDVRILTTSLSNQVITVSGATATISAPIPEGAMDEPASPYGPGDYYVKAGGFEEPAQADGGFKSVVPTGWTKPTGGTYVGTAGSGIYNPAGAAVAEGRQFAALQGNGTTLQQTVRVPADGLYKLSFYMSHRNGRGEGESTLRLQVKLGDDQVYYGPVATDSRGSMDVFKYYATELPPLKKDTAYDLKLVFANISGKDAMLLVDDVRITPLVEGEFVYIPNAGFESAGLVAFDKTNGGDAAVQGGNYTTSIFSWEAPVFSIEGKSCHARIAQNSIYYYWDYGLKFDYTGEPADERDYRKLVLARAGFARQAIKIPHPGRLRLSLRYSRSYIGARGHSVGVMLGETEVARTPAITDDFATKTFSNEFDWTGSGEAMLTVTNVLPVAVGDYYSIVDDIRLEYVGTALGDGESLKTTVTASTDGFYYAAITAAGLELETTSASGVYNSYKYYPARAQVTVDGAKVADCTVESPDYARLTVRLPYLKAGAHTIAVTGLADKVATLGKVRVLKAELLPLQTEDLDLPGMLFKFRLLEGAKLNLDYAGTAACRGLKVNGNSLSGLQNALNCDALHGPGQLNVKPDGLSIILR